MSAAQALTSGLPSSPPGVRSSSAGSATEGGDASFRETLETASRSGDAPESEQGRLSPARARAHKDHGAGGDREEPAAREGDGAYPRGETAGASVLSAMLAKLGGTPATADGAMDAVALAGSVSADAKGSGEPLDAGLWLPGQVGENGEPLDAEQLRTFLKSGAASLPSAEAGPDTLNIKVTVAGQETHLALDQAPSEALAMLSAAEDAAGASAALADGDGKAAVLGAGPSQAVADAIRTTRRAAVAGEPGPHAGAEAAPRVVAEEWGRGGGPAFADQGIAGQNGRQAEGRGSSGTSSQQQQGPGAFMAMLASAVPQAAGAVRDPAGAGVGHEPVSDQIAAEVRAELRADGLGEASSDGVVRVLHLELKPANLGGVTVRLALKDNAITIHLETQRLDTLAVIEREREALAGALASAGYTVEGITAQPQSDAGRSLASLAGPGDAGASQASPGAFSGQAGQGLAQSSGGQGRSGETESGDRQYRPRSDDKDNHVGGIRRDAGGIYV